MVDAIDDEDLAIIGGATADDVLVSGGSGLALGITGPGGTEASWAPPPADASRLCGSVSCATLARSPTRPVPSRCARSTSTPQSPTPTRRRRGRRLGSRSRPTPRPLCARHAIAPMSAPASTTSRQHYVVERVLTRRAGWLIGRNALRPDRCRRRDEWPVVRGLDIDRCRSGRNWARVCWTAAETSGSTLALALKSGNFAAITFLLRLGALGMNVRKQLIAAGRRLVDMGLSRVHRQPEHPDGDTILVTGTGASLGHLTEADIAEVCARRFTWPAPCRRRKPRCPSVFTVAARTPSDVHLHFPQAVAMSCRNRWSELNAVRRSRRIFVMRVGQTPLLSVRHPSFPSSAGSRFFSTCAARECSATGKSPNCSASAT